MEFSPESKSTTEAHEFKNISPTAFGHIYFRTFYNIPLASEMADIMEAKKRTGEMYGDQTIMIPVMEARYKGGEVSMENFIKKYPNSQILELAAGFSLHGATLSKRYPSIEYIETDLPEMIVTKGDVCKKLSIDKLPNLRLAPANALDLEALHNLVSASPERPLVIYNEGLMSYLTDEEKERLADVVKELSRGRNGIWITPDPALSAERRRSIGQLMPNWESLLKKVEETTKQKYDDHGFRSEQDADIFFEQNGFITEKVPQPTELDSYAGCDLSPELIDKLKENIRQKGKVWISRLDLQRKN